MKLTEVFGQGKNLLSFEVFPPNASTAWESVSDATRKIAGLNPAFISVTYGAGGGIGHFTADLAEDIGKATAVPTVAHLTCVSSSRETVQKTIRSFREKGIENVLALRGDRLPSDANAPQDYRYAIELVRELRESGGDFCIGGACYPEGHTESANIEEDIKHLKEKVDAGCDFLMTQLFFDNTLFSNFMYRAREAGISVPVIPGIMPITSATMLKRSLELSGAFVPIRFRRLIDRFGGNDAAMRQAGIAYATDQIIDLFAGGAPCVHVYTMNKPEIAAAIMGNLSEMLK